MAPAGLACDDPFTLGCQAAALTHGHPSGYLAAGALALMISELTRGRNLPVAVATAVSVLRQATEGEEVAAALSAAVHAVESGPLSADAICMLGEGWVAEEALAIAAHCALTATDFRAGVLLAVNHGGDSDSTGAICGNLLGASSAPTLSTATCSPGWKGATPSPGTPTTCTTCLPKASHRQPGVTQPSERG